MKKLISLIIIFFVGFNLIASETQQVFKSGEKLTYTVSYIAKLIPNTDVATVNVEVADTLMCDKQSYSISAHARVKPFFRWFFDLDDRYVSYIDKQTFLPVSASADLSEGKYKFRSRINFDWDSLQAKSTYRNLKHTQDKHKTMSLNPDSRDGISLFYHVRNKEIESMQLNVNQYLSLVLEDTVRTIDYRYMGKDKIKVKGLGRFNALKFSCTLVTSSGESFEDGTELFLWVSDDKNHVPLLVHTPIVVGSVRARLSDYSNLKYPLSSKYK